MSKPISLSKPASRPVSAMPTTPPAGPDRIASLPWNSSAAVRPPDDIMNIRRVSFSPSPLREGGGGVGRLSATPPRPPSSPGGGNELLRDLRHIAAQDRRQIGVHHGGVAAADQLDQRRDLVADRDLREAQVARERRDALLMLRIAIGMHEHDGDRVDAVGLRALELGAHGGEIERALDRAVGAHALVDLDDALVTASPA